VTSDQVTVNRWVQRFTVEFIEAARPCRHASETVGSRRNVREGCRDGGTSTARSTSVDRSSTCCFLVHRHLTPARVFFTWALAATGSVPVEVTTDRASVYPRVLDELVPAAIHTTEQYANNPVEADHGRLRARLRPMRGLKRHRSARALVAGHAFVQDLRRGHYESRPTYPNDTDSE
jgi:transposase, IS6 family